jgi:hypothetical protein
MTLSVPEEHVSMLGHNSGTKQDGQKAGWTNFRMRRSDD